VKVRLFRPTDTSTLARLFTDTVGAINSTDYSPEQIAAWASEPPDLNHWRDRLSSRMVFVAEHDTEITGFVTFEANGHLDHLYVHHRFQRQGVATALCRRVEHEARSTGTMRLFTEASITARPFFERIGFQMIAPQTVAHRGVSFTNFRMEKFLC
jgi:putative acetyltransferase